MSDFGIEQYSQALKEHYYRGLGIDPWWEREDESPEVFYAPIVATGVVALAVKNPECSRRTFLGGAIAAALGLAVGGLPN